MTSKMENDSQGNKVICDQPLNQLHRQEGPQEAGEFTVDYIVRKDTQKQKNKARRKEAVGKRNIPKK